MSMKIIQAKEPRWVDKEHVYLEILVDFDGIAGFGEYVPHITASFADTEHGRALYERALSGEFGSIQELETPTSDQVIKENELAASNLKAEKLGEPVEYAGKLFQVSKTKDGKTGVENINNAFVQTLVDESKSFEWVTKDNTIMIIGKSDLQNIITLIGERDRAIGSKYNEWRAGDKLTPFVV